MKPLLLPLLRQRFERAFNREFYEHLDRIIEQEVESAEFKIPDCITLETLQKELDHVQQLYLVA